jgi:glycosyltransferase involved in cell wall biosynthesis
MPSNESPGVSILASTLVTGGAERVVQALVRGLPSEGFSPRVLCLHEPGDVGGEIAADGAAVESGLVRFRFDPLGPIRVARRLRARGDSILLVIDHHDAIFCGALAARGSRIDHALLAIHSTGLWGTGRSFSLSDRLVLPSYERVVALAATHARDLAAVEGVPGKKLCVVQNGVNVRRFKPAESAGRRSAIRGERGIPEGAVVVTMVAALRPEKNHEMFLRAAAKLVRSGNRFAFLLVGEGREAEKLQVLAGELSLGEAVRFMGRRSDVAEILAATDVAVLCSHPVVETFPLVVLEAMASGVPVVATDVGSIRDMLDSGSEGFIVPPGDVEALAGKILVLAGDSALRGEMGSRGRVRAGREFSEEEMVRRYGNLFRGLLER